MKVVVLPGLDGTGRLLQPFVDAAPAGYDVRALAYPADQVLTLDDYAELVATAVDEETLLIAESFSGPIAIRVAARRPLSGLVLCATFVTAPFPRVLRFLAVTDAARIPVPEWMLRYWMGAGREVADAMRVAEPRVIASRIRLVLTTDERATLSTTTVPLLDLRGTADRMVSARQRQLVLGARPDVRIADVAGGTHVLLLTKPAEAWATIAGRRSSRRRPDSNL